MNAKKLYAVAKKYHLSGEVINEMAIPSYTHYSPLVRWVFFKRLAELTKNVDFDNKTVLDFGCGTGIWFSKYARAKKIYAADLHPQIAKETAIAAGIKVDFIKGIKELRDESIDVAVFADVLEHIENYDEIILELNNKMKKKGLVLVSLPTETSFYKFCRIMVGYGNKAHYHRINPKEILLFLNKVFKKNEEKDLPALFTLFKIVKYTKK